MRTRVSLVVLSLIAGMLAFVGVASGQSGGSETPELNALVQAFRDATVKGDNVVVSEPVPDNPILNPFGGEADLPPDISDRIRVEATTQFQLNPAGPYQFFEQDPMGVPGLTYDPNVAGFDQAPGAFDFAIPQGWVPPSFGSSPTFGELLAGFVGLPAPPPGFDDMLSGDQPFPVDGAIIVPPAGDLLPPANTPWIVRGARLADPMPEGFCAGKILEFFSGDAVPGQPTWVPADFAPNDSFAGLSTAFATRCIDGQLQPTQMLVNNGSSFQPQGTFATAVIYPDAFFQLVPVTDIPASDGWRAGAFATDASNPFQPDNSGFSTFPTYPDLVPGSRPNVFIEPVMPGYPTFPVAFEFMGINGTDLDYENNFGLVVDPTQPGDDPAEFKVDLVQYDTWQISSGLLRYADDTQTLEGTLSGSGDGYSEEYDFGADTYVHEADTVDEFNFAFAPDDSVAGPFLTYLQEQFGVRQASIETTTTSVATSTSQAGAGQETTTTAAPTASGSSGPFLWLIVLGILLIVAGFVLWLLFGRKKPDPCAELYTAWQKAKAACDEATSEAKTKRQEAEGARTAREAADRTLDDHCTKYPPACGPQASVSSGDRTVTRDDVYVNRAWNAAAWKKYKDGGSAEATQDDWNNGPTDEFRDTALKELDAAKAKTPDLEKAAEDAATTEADATAAADKAEAAATKACETAESAKKAYDECVGAARAGAAAADASATGAAAGAMGGIAGAVAGSAGPPASGGGNCDAEQQAYDAAKKMCDDAVEASRAADQAVDDAHSALDEAQDALRRLCAEYPPLCGPDAWIEESGKPETRIDRSDLFARDLWSEQVWTDYQSDQIDAQDVQDRWRRGPSDDFVRDAKQKLADAAPLKPAREQAIKDAEARLGSAEQTARDARFKADDACATAQAAKDALDACRGA